VVDRYGHREAEPNVQRELGVLPRTGTTAKTSVECRSSQELLREKESALKQGGLGYVFQCESVRRLSTAAFQGTRFRSTPAGFGTSGFRPNQPPSIISEIKPCASTSS
jgi:hypothetical protein